MPIGNPFFTSRQAPPLPEYFVPRSEFAWELKQRLLSNEPAPPGVLVVSAIHGLGGVGKSTIAAALAHDEEIVANFSNGILWATLGQEPDLLSLLNVWMQELGDYSARPTTVQAASGRLRSLLHDKAALLVVDDVWAAEHAASFCIGGSRCHVLLTTREAAIADKIPTGAKPFSLNVMSESQALALFRGRLERELQAEEIEPAAKVAREVGYLPLALGLIAAQIAEGLEWSEVLTELCKEIPDLASFDLLGAEDETDEAIRKRCSLLASFSLSLRRLKEDERHWFTWLGIVAEDSIVTAQMAATLWATSESSANSTLRLLKQKSLLLAGPQLASRVPSYRLHDLVKDVARHLLTSTPDAARPTRIAGLGISLPQAHQLLLQRYQASLQHSQWHALLDDGYIHEHLTWHMEQADQIEQMISLLQEETPAGRNAWYETRERLGQPAGFIQDILRALEHVQERSRRSSAQGTPIKTLGLECRFALMLASLNSLVANIPISLIAVLVRFEIWTTDIGLAYARQFHDPVMRVRALVGIARNMEQPRQCAVLSEALQVAKRIKNGCSRAHALAEVATCLSEPEQTGAVLSEALRVLTETPQAVPENPEYRPQVLVSMAPHLTEPQLLEAISVARELKHIYHGGRALVAMLPYLARMGQVERAFEVAKEIPHPHCHAQALACVARYQSEPQQRAQVSLEAGPPPFL